MKNINSRIKLSTGLVAFAFVSGCSFENLPTESTNSEVYSKKFEAALAAKNVSPAASAHFAKAAKSKSSGKETVTDISTAVLSGAIASLKSESTSALTGEVFSLSTAAEKLAVMDEIVKSAFSLLKGEDNILSKDEQIKLRGDLVKSAMVALRSAGLSKSDYAFASKVILQAAGEALEESGVEAADIATTKGGLTEGASEALSAGGFAKDVKDDMAGQSTQGAVLSIKDVLSDATKLAENSKAVIANMMGSVDSFSADLAASGKQEVYYSIMNSAVSALADSSFSDANRTTMIGYFVAGAISVVDDLGITSATDYAAAINAIVRGSIVGVKNFVASKEDIVTYATLVATSSTAGIADSLDIDADKIEKVMTSVMEGSISAMVKAGLSVSVAAEKTLLLNSGKALASAVTAKLDDAKVDSDKMVVVLKAVANGIAQGLEKAKFTDAEIKAVSATIATDMKTMATSEGILDVTDLATIDTVVSASLSATVDAYEEPTTEDPGEGTSTIPEATGTTSDGGDTVPADSGEAPADPTPLPFTAGKEFTLPQKYYAK